VDSCISATNVSYSPCPSLGRKSAQAIDSWSRSRRVVGKAEVTRADANPRFVVTSLRSSEIAAQYLYETIYCARGEMENRIKECQLDLFADRTSAATMRANQLRLWFAAMAYVLLCALRRIGLAHTQFAEATCGTIRLKLLKLGALVRISVRRIKFAIASAYPWQNEFALAHVRLRNVAARHEIDTVQPTSPARFRHRGSGPPITLVQVITLPFGAASPTRDPAAPVAECVVIAVDWHRGVRGQVVRNDNVGDTGVVSVQHQHHRCRLRALIDQLVADAVVHGVPRCDRRAGLRWLP